MLRKSIRCETCITWAAVAIFFFIFWIAALNFEPTRRWFCGTIEEGSCTRRLISEFQALLVGVAAVAAAAWTVVTMQKIDAASEKRHRELVGLSLRSERLQVERIIQPHLPTLHTVLKTVLGIEQQVMVVEHEGSFYDALKAFITTAGSAATMTERVFSDNEWSIGKNLFDGRTVIAIENLLTSSDDVTQYISSLSEAGSRLRKRGNEALTGRYADGNGIVDREEAQASANHEIEHLQTELNDRARLSTFRINLEEVISSLERLRERYSGAF